MLSQLSVQGLAIIDSLSIAFSPGFNVITGETGAGKSILIKALNFLLGGKVTADMVRNGAAQAVVCGEFVVPDGHPALDVLGSLGVPVEQNGDGHGILVRRQLTAKGRSQSWVNDVPVTGSPLRELGMALVDIFGQHENQRLMDTGQHIHYVDAFLKDDSARGLVRACYAEVAALQKEIESLVAAFRAGKRSYDYLGFRVRELREFDPAPEDYETLRAYCLDVDARVRLQASFSKAASVLDSGEEGVSPATALREVAKVLTGIEEASELRESATRLAAEIDDLSYEVGRALSRVDVDEKRLEDSQQRLFGYQDLMRKHAAKDVESLLEEALRMGAELEFLEVAEARLEETVAKVSTKVTELGNAARALTDARGAAARKIKKRVEMELHELAMPGATFQVEFIPVSRACSDPDLSGFSQHLISRWAEARGSLVQIGESGAEKGQFLLSSNAGEPALPLERIASGGELSRIMLALKKTLAADAETCVLVFDEIDSGISGRVADVVGQKMRDLAENFQVICISHLPQVAVYADTHFLVRKEEKGERTESRIVRLTREESAREVARLLSGAKVSRPSLENARSLMRKAREGRTSPVA